MPSNEHFRSKQQFWMFVTFGTFYLSDVDMCLVLLETTSNFVNFPFKKNPDLPQIQKMMILIKLTWTKLT